jgi:hypothetical protein
MVMFLPLWLFFRLLKVSCALPGLQNLKSMPVPAAHKPPRRLQQDA